MLRLLSLIIIVTLVGCGRGGAFQRGVAPAEPEGDWFCEMAVNAEDWACVQDPDLARSPRPTRLPRPPPPVAAEDHPAMPELDDGVSAAEPPGAEADLSEVPPAPQTQKQPEPPEPPAAPMESSGRETIQGRQKPDTGQATRTGEQPLPTYVRLAYQPAKPTPLLDLPPDFYAVQLIAMSSRKRLEKFVEDNRLEGMSAARVERDGELYYVLILGIYETHELAEEASRHIPPPLDTRTPWIRPLGALQEAMLRADALAGDSLKPMQRPTANLPAPPAV